MADTTIGVAYVNFNYDPWRGGIYWKSTTTGYIIYVNADYDLVYRKTTNGGSTWSDENSLVAGTIEAYDCWADWETTNDIGTKIHFACIDGSSNDVIYGYLDVDDDSEYTDKIEDCQGTGTFGDLGTHSYKCLSITKTRGGNIAVVFFYRDSAGTFFYMFYTSPDGDTWTSKATPWEATADLSMLFPANLADDDDLWCVFWDVSALKISLKTYDNSENSWSETEIGAGYTSNVSILQFNGTIRHSDGHLLLAVWPAYNASNADLRTWDITDAGTMTAKTNVLTDTDDSFCVSITYDNKNAIVYVAYKKSDYAYYKKSTDGMATWSAETAMTVGATAIRWLSSGGINASWGGKFLPVGYNYSSTAESNTLSCNVDNGVTIAGDPLPSTINHAVSPALMAMMS